MNNFTAFGKNPSITFTPSEISRNSIEDEDSRFVVISHLSGCLDSLNSVINQLPKNQA